MKLSNSKSTKTAYERPQLFEYGNVRDITLAVGRTSSVPDGGGGNTKNTS